MARRPIHTKPERPVLTIEQKRQAIAQLQRRVGELEAFDPQTIVDRFSDPTVTGLQAAIDRTLVTIFGHGTYEHNHYSAAARLDNGPITLTGPDWLDARGAGRRNDRFDAIRHITEGKLTHSPCCARPFVAWRKKLSFLRPDLPSWRQLPILRLGGSCLRTSTIFDTGTADTSQLPTQFSAALRPFPTK